MFTYCQRTGTIRFNGMYVSTGYSGHGEGKNNPDMQEIHDVGPIPVGDWTIAGPPENRTSHGDFVLRLEPKIGTETFGRSSFLMHGDMLNPALAGTASKGCIIQSRLVREAIWATGDRDLRVFAEEIIET